MNGFYVIEGDNGVGKTTLLERLTANTGCVGIHTPEKEYMQIRSHVLNNNSPKGKFYYFLSSVYDAAETVKKILPQSDVFCDRYIGSTVVGHLIETDRQFEEFHQEYGIIKNTLLMPQATILLRCNYYERVKRILDRNDGIMGRDETNVQISERLDDIYQHLATTEPNWYIIDTTDKTIDSITDEVIKLLNLTRKNNNDISCKTDHSY